MGSDRVLNTTCCFGLPPFIEMIAGVLFTLSVSLEGEVGVAEEEILCSVVGKHIFLETSFTTQPASIVLLTLRAVNVCRHFMDIISRHVIVLLNVEVGCVFDQSLSYVEIILRYRVTDGEDI